MKFVVIALTNKKIYIFSSCLLAVVSSIMITDENKHNLGLKIVRSHEHKKYSKNKVLTNPELFR